MKAFLLSIFLFSTTAFAGEVFLVKKELTSIVANREMARELTKENCFNSVDSLNNIMKGILNSLNLNLDEDAFKVTCKMVVIERYSSLGVERFRGLTENSIEFNTPNLSLKEVKQRLHFSSETELNDAGARFFGNTHNLVASMDPFRCGPMNRNFCADVSKKFIIVK